MEFADLDEKLPTGEQDFVTLRQKGMVYVDKTRFVYQIARKRRPIIITRPRLCGKSTLQSTLEELFLHGVAPYDGHDSYFKGLAIEELWQDQGKYLVLRLNFDELTCNCATAAEFKLRVLDAVSAFCRAHELSLPNKELKLGRLFRAMLKQLNNQSLVLLVDEYDAPVLQYASAPAELAACAELLRTLFGSVKIHCDKFRCAFFTGITRYQDLGIGTADNNLTDWTNDAALAACCGYTRDELKQYFADHLRYAASIHAGCAPEKIGKAQIEALLDQMAAWYGGYSFDGSPHHKVFSPWAVLQFFKDDGATLQERWSLETDLGLQQLLTHALARLDLKQLQAKLVAGDIAVSKDLLVKSAPFNPEANPYALLCQVGFLTLREPFSADSYVHLTCPNEESRRALSRMVARQPCHQ